MSKTPDLQNAPDAHAPFTSRLARRLGAPRDAAVPRMEDVRITAPDLDRRATMDKTRGRLVLAAGGFMVLFTAIGLKLVIG